MENKSDTTQPHKPRGTEFFSSQKIINDATHSIHGFYLFGKIEGVDFTVEGKLQDGTKYGNSLKLKFSQAVPTLKDLNGISVQILVYKTQTIVINCESKDELSQLVSDYSSKVGQNVVIELNVPDNQKFKALSIKSY
ncbi:MAG: hypothetical protein PHD79_10290 [Aliarcobacter sp.]|nr:hypothetical protein [Aliarcobacter sp.]